MLKSTLFLAPVLGLSAYFFGVFDSNYERTVDRPRDEVVEALGDFQLSRMEGSPGSDPSLSGGVPSLLTSQRTEKGWAFIVRSGEDVAITFYADVEDLGDGRSKVVAHVERGNASDDFTAPMFRSESTSLAMFGMALEDDLNRLTLPRHASREECAQLLERLLGQPSMSNRPHEPTTLREAMSNTAKVGINLAGAEAELRRAGCDTTQPPDFDKIQERLGPASPPTFSAAPPPPPPTFAPRGGHDAQNAARAAHDAASRAAQAAQDAARRAGQTPQY